MNFPSVIQLNSLPCVMPANYHCRLRGLKSLFFVVSLDDLITLTLCDGKIVGGLLFKSVLIINF